MYKVWLNGVQLVALDRNTKQWINGLPLPNLGLPLTPGPSHNKVISLCEI